MYELVITVATNPILLVHVLVIMVESYFILTTYLGDYGSHTSNIASVCTFE